MEQSSQIKTISNAYIYGLPLVGMYELLYNQVFNPETRQTNLQEFAHTATVASPSTSFIPAPNNDTTYSRAWLDLRNGPVFLEVPDMEDRYYSIQFLNQTSETITNIGKRTTGTKSNCFMITGPDFQEEVPEAMNRINSKTPFVLAFLRILVGSEQELATIRALQSKFIFRSKTMGLSKITSPLPEYLVSDDQHFFILLSKLLELIPIPEEEASFKKEILQFSALPLSLLKQGCDAARNQIKESSSEFGEQVNYWRIARKGIGNYGSDYLQRSVVWFKGALANQPEESLYPSTFQDESGDLLNGIFCYQLIFKKGKLPPVTQFWSITMYRFSDAFLVDNPINRYSIGDRTEGLIYEPDGSLILTIQKEKPEAKTALANWLPAPEDAFYLTLRLYGPKSSAIFGEWTPPALHRTC